MSTLVVIGAQWGDEGKGKLVDYLTAKADFVVRFQGGNNAGHTLVVDDKSYKLSLIPSGVLRPGCKCIIAGGVVVDAAVLLAEIDTLRSGGIEISSDRLFIDRETHLILPYHKAIDRAREEQLGDKKIGTTGRGIGPAYEDRAERCGVRMAEIADLSLLQGRFKKSADAANRYLKFVLQSSQSIEVEDEWRALAELLPRVAPFVSNTSKMLYEAIKAGKRVLFEGAQGTLLDSLFGTVPFVTSSHTLAGAATVGCGIGPKAINYVLGVAKAYSTRVGSGPFPTELDDATGEIIRAQGREFGTVTGRPRRCGWLDVVALKRAVRLNGIDSIALTKLDVLAGLEKVKLCVKYRLNGEELDDMPALASHLELVDAEYLELPGWGSEISKAATLEELPKSARKFVATIEEQIECPVEVISVGPERRSTIFSQQCRFLGEFL